MTLTIVMLAVLSGDDAGEEHDDCSDDDDEDDDDDDDEDGESIVMTIRGPASLILHAGLQHDL